MQRDVDRVDSSNVYTHSIEQLLADLPPPPHVCRQSTLPLSSVRTQTTASAYVNTDSTPSLSAQRYADTPLYVNTSAYSNAPPTRPGQSNVTDMTNLYAQSYTFDAQHSSGLVALDRNMAYTHSSSMVAFHPTVCTSYADNSQRLPIAVDPTVQYAVCTSAIADNVWPTVTAHPAPLHAYLASDPGSHYTLEKEAVIRLYSARYRGRCTDTCSPRHSVWLHKTTDF